MAPKTDHSASTPQAVLDSLVERLDPKDQKLFRAVRTVLRKLLPTANELAYDYGSHVAIAYSPTQRGIDSIFSILGRADGVQLYFTQGKQLPDPNKLLSGSGKLTRFIRVDAAKQLALPEVSALMSAAIAAAPVPLLSEGEGILVIQPTSVSKRSSRSAEGH